MRSREVLKIQLETGIIAVKRVQNIIHIRLRKCRVDHCLRVHRHAVDTGHAEEGLEGEVTANVVRNGVGNLDILEATGEDLVVIVRVTPGPKTLSSGVRKDRSVIEVRGV